MSEFTVVVRMTESDYQNISFRLSDSDYQTVRFSLLDSDFRSQNISLPESDCQTVRMLESEKGGVCATYGVSTSLHFLDY